MLTNSKLIFFALALLSLILAVRVGYYLHSYKPYSSGTKITFQTQLSDQPKISSRGQKVTLTMPNSQRVSVNFALFPLLSYGDKVKLEGRVQYFNLPAGRQELSDGRQIAFMNYPRFKVIEAQSQSNLIYKARFNIVSFFNSSLGPTESALMLGIVFGIKQEMDSQFYTNLQNSGLLHVIAASGMNVTMVGGFLHGLLTGFFRRQLALVITIFGILFYVLLAGFEPSIVRAAIMGILVIFAQLLGRQNSAFLGLFGAGFIMIFINPSLVYDIGFQLSFMATLGLIFLRPIFTLSRRLESLLKRSIIGEDVATTITAQVVTLPILLVNFGSYSLVSILVNGILLWAVPILMIIGGFAGMVGLILEPVGRLIAYLALPLLYYFEAVVNLFGSFGGVLTIDHLPLTIFLGYYLILLSIIVWVRRK